MRFRNFVTFCVIAAGSCFAVQAFGQTITTGPVPNSLCPGDTVYVPFTATGTFQLQNAFTAQISNPNGRFDSSFARLGATTDPNATYIIGVVPSDLAPGAHYRIRVISTLPTVYGSDNGSDISVGVFITVEYGVNVITRNKNNFAALTNTPVTFTNYSYGGTGTYSWNFGDGASPAASPDSIPGSVTYATTGVKKIILTATSSGGCTSNSQQFISNQHLSIYDCFPAIQQSAIVDSSNFLADGINDTIWIVSGGTCDAYGNNEVFFVEPGSNVNIVREGNDVVYLKEGGSCNIVSSSYGCAIIYVDSTGIIFGTHSDGGTNTALLHCPTLKFDYTNAPPYHLPTLGVYEGSTAPLNISLYPNPTNDMLHVFTGATMPSSVRLFNALGETVWSAAGHVTNSVQIATDNLQNGVYYLQVVAAGAMRTEKVTVIH